MTELFEFVLQFDQHLDRLTSEYGTWTYAILFAIIFCETGLVVTPILPGDSLLFTVGVFAARDNSGLNLWMLYAVLFPAAVLGDTLNYHIGKYVGPKILSGKVVRWLNQEHMAYTQRFFERHGGKTIVLARFLPIVRTFAPFVAGVGNMYYPRFLAYNVVGGFIWVFGIVTAGYLLGENQFVEENFELVLVIIVFASLIPGTLTYLRQRYGKREVASVAEPTSQQPEANNLR